MSRFQNFAAAAAENKKCAVLETELRSILIDQFVNSFNTELIQSQTF